MHTYLFVNKECEYSCKYLNLLDKYWRHSDIDIVFLDQLEPDEIPEYIDRTPSLLLVDNNNDSQVFDGQEAFEWLFKNVTDLYTIPVPVDVKNKKNGMQQPEPNLNNGGNGMPPIGGEKITYGSTKGLVDTRDFDNKADVMKLFEEREAEYAATENCQKVG